MRIWSWLFPSDADRLASARAHIAAGRHAKARAVLMQCHAPEAEALYEQCSTAIEAEDRRALKLQHAAAGFHGWRLEIEGRGKKLKAELEKLLHVELERGGIDLDLPHVDEDAFRAAVARAQRRVRSASARQACGVRLVPIVDEHLAQRLK